MILDFQKYFYLVTLPRELMDLLIENRSILNTTIEYIVSSKRFDVSLFDSRSV